MGLQDAEDGDAGLGAGRGNHRSGLLVAHCGELGDGAGLGGRADGGWPGGGRADGRENLRG